MTLLKLKDDKAFSLDIRKRFQRKLYLDNLILKPARAFYKLFGEANLERMVNIMEDQEKYEQEADVEEGGDTSNWMRDNLRIIISIIIVVAIAGGVYSYSKKNQAPANNPADEQVAENEQSIEVQKNEEKTAGASQQKQPAAEKIATSQETEGSFIETAIKGDGQTHLARRALANYLEKNPDSALTAEHKIYIEDYLRKNSGFKKSVHVGTSVEFSKDLVKKAIENSKKLNDKQLQNLHKYAVRVPSLA